MRAEISYDSLGIYFPILCVRFEELCAFCALAVRALELDIDIVPPSVSLLLMLGWLREGSVCRTGTGPQCKCLKEPGKARDAISMQREWGSPNIFSTP